MSDRAIGSDALRFPTRGTSRRTFIQASAAGVLGLGGSAAGASLSVEEAVSLADSRRRELVDLLMRLVRIRSQSGETAESAQAVVREYLGTLPYRIEESADRPSRFVDHPEYMPPNPPGDGPFVNLVGHPTGPRARHAMFSHIDTHIIADGWTTEPYEPVIRDGRMYGLGTADDKGGIAAMLVAAAALAEVGGPMPVVMSLHGKGGGSRGSLPVFERLRKARAKLEGVLYVHPAETGRGLEDIKTEVQGIVDLELSVTGWRAPPMEINSIDSASWADGGNALDACLAAIEHLRTTAFSGVRLNLGKLNGGDRVGSVAETASATFRLKFSGTDTWRALLERGHSELVRFHPSLSRSGARGFDLSLQTVGYRTNPGKADWASPESLALRDAIEGVTGAAPAAYPNHYAGDIRYPIRLLGVPAYGIGSLGGGFYGANEWVDIDDLVRLTAVCIHTIAGWGEIRPA
ncbi:MAG: M20/M25/M40 family metallo-hydrolase [Pseudomonadota bacterium]